MLSLATGQELIIAGVQFVTVTSSVGSAFPRRYTTCSDLQTSGVGIANIRPTGARSLQLANPHWRKITATETQIDCKWDCKHRGSAHAICNSNGNAGAANIPIG